MKHKLQQSTYHNVRIPFAFRKNARRLFWIGALVLSILSCIWHISSLSVWPYKKTPTPPPITSTFLHRFYNLTCPPGARCIGIGSQYFGRWNWWPGRQVRSCDGVHVCPIVADNRQAHVLVLHGPDLRSEHLSLPRLRNQRWIFVSAESPTSLKFELGRRSYDFFTEPKWRHAFHWVASYRRDADIPVTYGCTVRSRSTPSLPTTARREKMALAVISNCYSSTGRLEFIQQLQYQLGEGQLDILGACGQSVPSNFSFEAVARRYHFYLSFENAFCQDYITEKFWYNGLLVGMVPVVVGGLNVQDYIRVAPPHSFIYVSENASPMLVARQLSQIVANESTYLAFHKWRKLGYEVRHDSACLGPSMANMTTHIGCSVCSKLHAANDLKTESLTKDLYALYHPDHCSGRTLRVQS